MEKDDDRRPASLARVRRLLSYRSNEGADPVEQVGLVLGSSGAIARGVFREILAATTRASQGRWGRAGR